MQSGSNEFSDIVEHKQNYSSRIGIQPPSLFDGHDVYLNSYNLYLFYLERIPSKITIHHSNIYQVIDRIEVEFADRIIEKHYLRYSLKDFENYKYTNVIYVLNNQIIIDIEFTGELGILFCENSEQDALIYEKAFAEKYKRKRECKINLLSEGHLGTELLPLNVKKPNLDITLNYNVDLIDLHEYLLKVLSKKNNSGLVLLHGKPGTGKSTYIRYLINCLKKKIIFLPPSIAGVLDSPSMTSILVENPNVIFIIEDAEQLIKSREDAGGSNLSMLLNLTDGILGECLNTLVICTFNTDLKNIDEALLRKGRLIASYRFEELAIEKLLLLKDHLGLDDLKIDQGMVLSDLYHPKENQFGNSKKKKRMIGFQGK